MKILCIGGSMDGQWVEVQDSREIVAMVPIVEPFPEDYSYIDNSTVQTRTQEVEHYHRKRIRTTRHMTYPLLVIEGMEFEDALESLMDNYRPKKD